MSKKIIIPKEEKNRILEMHSILNKNQYSINEATDKEIAGLIYKGSDGFGTSKEFLDGIQLISSKQQAMNVDYILRNNYQKLGLAGYIQDEFDMWDARDRESINLFKKHLAKFGITLNVTGELGNDAVTIDFNATQTPPQTNTKLSTDDSSLKACVDFVLKKMGYNRDGFAQTYNSNPNDDKQLAKNLLTTYNDQTSKRAFFPENCLSTFKYSLGIQDTNKKQNDGNKKQTEQKTPYVNKYMEDLKKQLQLPTDTTKQDTLNALMAKLNEIPVKQ